MERTPAEIGIAVCLLGVVGAISLRAILLFPDLAFVIGVVVIASGVAVDRHYRGP